MFDQLFALWALRRFIIRTHKINKVYGVVWWSSEKKSSIFHFLLYYSRPRRHIWETQKSTNLGFRVHIFPYNLGFMCLLGSVLVFCYASTSWVSTDTIVNPVIKLSIYSKITSKTTNFVTPNSPGWFDWVGVGRTKYLPALPNKNFDR